LSLTCTISETGTLEPYSRDPARHRAEGGKTSHCHRRGDQAFFGPEAEFFIFDNVQFDSKSNGTFYSVDSEEGIWNTGRR
jgi:glutamine synthetase